ncbi:photosystem II stability/assembly factor HCF136 chloroplastic-like, partial [Trifolium medium]|nr:photosystem II stability/assembly factor HCF136 chloroplastic-like [Trifolium medium]
ITEEFEEIPVQSRGFGILDVGYRSTDEAWAAGGSGILLRTNNGGKSWIRDKAADNIAANLYAVKSLFPTKPGGSICIMETYLGLKYKLDGDDLLGEMEMVTLVGVPPLLRYLPASRSVTPSRSFSPSSTSAATSQLSLSSSIHVCLAL